MAASSFRQRCLTARSLALGLVKSPSRNRRQTTTRLSHCFRWNATRSAPGCIPKRVQRDRRSSSSRHRCIGRRNQACVRLSALCPFRRQEVPDASEHAVNCFPGVTSALHIAGFGRYFDHDCGVDRFRDPAYDTSSCRATATFRSAGNRPDFRAAKLQNSPTLREGDGSRPVGKIFTPEV